LSLALETIKVEHNPFGGTPDAAVIWLHGLGADGHDFEGIVPQLRLPDSMAIRFVFPHAPIRPVTINMGYEMRSWYDILSMAEVREINPQQLQESCNQLEQLIEKEIERGISSERIVIAGFSQGGAVALTAVPCYAKPLAGIMALSTYLPLADYVAKHRAQVNAEIPIFMGHGVQDPVVAHALGIATRDQLKAWSYEVQWHEYAMPHAVCLEEIADISAWLIELLKA